VTVARRAARVLLLADDAVLLVRGFDPGRPDAGSWWQTPGGGIEEGESLELAAVRETLEETGLTLAPAMLGPVVAERWTEYEFEAVTYRQEEWFFAVRVDRFEPASDRWDAVEQRSLLGYRWWTVDELATTDETVFPRELGDVVRALLDRPVDRSSAEVLMLDPD
jgi:8-oxo-dGTP pyrophosphatase MutT (NUDIX family)